MLITLPYNFKPRPYQIPILRALDSGFKRAVWVAHRRSGKDMTILNWVIKRLMQEVCVCFYVTPSYAQGKKIIWDAINSDGFRILDHFPKQIIENMNQQEMKIRLINGSLFQIVGSENIDSIVGTNPKIIVFSEYAVQDKKAWDYLRPIVKINGGYAIFISTPRGKNHFFELVKIAQDNPESWFYEKLTVDDTNVLTAEDIEQERRDGMSEEMVLQEYYCDFDRGVDGCFYGKLIEKMRKEERICSVPYESRSVVNTSWDIGYGDATAIVFWQQCGGEVRIIDYYENEGEGVAHYVKFLQSKEYLYGSHYYPHDAGAGSMHSGKSLVQVAGDLGLRVNLLKRDGISIGIEAARSLLSMCYIDEKKCKNLIDSLENYHKKYNEKMDCYSDTPVHDWSSHAADAFRYTAMSRETYGGSVTGKRLTAESIAEMRRRNYGY
jgi:phage terminase large subunit